MSWLHHRVALPTREPTPSSRDVWTPLCCVGVFALYAVTLPTTLTEGDAGEWSVIAKHGGVPHPSGYPLYAMLARGMVFVLADMPVVTALALLSALCCALAAVVLCSALKRLGIDGFVAACATFVVMTSSVVWRMANIPEPFALNLLLASLILLLASYAYVRRQQGDEPLVWWAPLFLGVCFGFGFCNHHSLVWLVPVGAYVLACSRHGWRRTLLYFFCGFVVGLAPLTYFLIARGDASPYDYYQLETWRDLWRLLLRTPYGTLQLTRNHQGSNWQSLSYFLLHLPRWLSVLFFLSACVGVGVLVRKLQRATVWKERSLWVAWFASWALASVVFLSMFNVEVTSWIPSIVERFMALPVFLLAVPLAYGLEVMVRHSRLPLVTCRVIVGIAVIGHAAWQAQASNRANEVFFESHVRSLFSLLPVAGDVLVTASDSESLGAMYGRNVLGLGDARLLWLNAPHWANRGFRQRTLAAWRLPEAYSGLRLSGLVGELLSARGRVAVTDLPLPPRPKLFEHAFPVGPVMVLVRETDPLPSLDEIWRLNEAFFSDTQIPSCADGGRLKAWDTALLTKYKEGLERLMAMLASEQRDDLVARAHLLQNGLDPCLVAGR